MQNDSAKTQTPDPQKIDRTFHKAFHVRKSTRRFPCTENQNHPSPLLPLSSLLHSNLSQPTRSSLVFAQRSTTTRSHRRGNTRKAHPAFVSISPEPLHQPIHRTAPPKHPFFGHRRALDKLLLCSKSHLAVRTQTHARQTSRLEEQSERGDVASVQERVFHDRIAVEFSLIFARHTHAHTQGADRQAGRPRRYRHLA